MQKIAIYPVNPGRLAFSRREGDGKKLGCQALVPLGSWYLSMSDVPDVFGSALSEAVHRLIQGVGSSVAMLKARSNRPDEPANDEDANLNLEIVEGRRRVHPAIPDSSSSLIVPYHQLE